MRNKYAKGQRKHIRREKARIRSEFSNAKKQEEAVKKLFDKVSGKLHVHPAPKTAEKSKKADKKSKPAKEVKKAPVAKKEAKGTIEEEKAQAAKDIKPKKEKPSSVDISVDKQKHDNK